MIRTARRFTTLSYLAVFWAMARPMQLFTVALVFITGTLMARATNHVLMMDGFLWTFAVLMPIAASIHYANECADYETDQLTQRTLFSGGSGTSYRVPRQWIFTAALMMLAVGLMIALLAFMLGKLYPAALLLLIGGAVGGWMYSLPPLQLAWRGWGELDNALLGGMILPLYGYAAQTGFLTGSAILAFVPFTALVFINLLATTWADRTADAQVGKYTLATRYVRFRLQVLYAGVAILTIGMFLLAYDQVLPIEAGIGMLLVVPLMGWGILTYTRVHSPHPTVLAMAAMLGAQLIGWFLAGI